jgi:hypothetical protein
MKPTKAQERAEKRLRDMGVTVTTEYSSIYPHECDPPDPHCFRCQMKASNDRVNGVES